MSEPKKVKISLTSGDISGVEDSGCRSFRGIPFAEPPVGPLRFKKPVAVKKWDGVLCCETNGPQMPQGELRVEMLLWTRAYQVLWWTREFTMGYGWNDNPEKPKPLPTESIDDVVAMDEGALQLNVFSRDTAKAGDNLPVMVFIHGGGFHQGAGNSRLFAHGWGSRLAKRENVVLVTINYRLGALGFLKVDGGDYNCGLWDQIAALQWVQREIGAFGGDANNVCVFGESAGAMSIGVLLASRAARGLFHKAIMQSGAGSMVLTRQQAEHTSKVFAEKVLALAHCTAESLVNVDAATMRAAQTRLMRGFGRDVGMIPFQPVIDNDLIDGHPLTVLAAEAARGESNDFPALLVGWNRDEYQFFRKVRPSPDCNWLGEARARIMSHTGPGNVLVPRKKVVDSSTESAAPLNRHINPLEAKALHEYPQHPNLTECVQSCEIATELLELLYIDACRRRGEKPLETSQQILDYICAYNKFAWNRFLDDFTGYAAFGAPLLITARHASRLNSKTFVYSFDMTSALFFDAAAHAIELPYVFGTYDQPQIDKFIGCTARLRAAACRWSHRWRPGDVQVAQRVSHNVMRAWANFARCSDPNDAQPSAPVPAAVPSGGLLASISSLFSSAPDTMTRDAEAALPVQASVSGWLPFATSTQEAVMHIDQTWQCLVDQEPLALYRIAELREQSEFSWGGPAIEIIKQVLKPYHRAQGYGPLKNFFE